MGSSVLRLRTRGSSVPAAARRAPSARPGAAHTLLGLFHWHTCKNSHYTFVRWSFSSWRGSTRHSVLFIYIVWEPDSQPRRTNCVLTRRARTSLALGKTHQNPREKDSRPVAPPHPATTTSSLCYFLSFFFLAIYFLLPNQEPGTEPVLRGWKKTRFVIEALRLFFWIYFAVEEKRSGSGTVRKKKPRSSSSSSSSSVLFHCLSLHLSICLPILFYLSLHFFPMFVGPCDFAKMHHQQRMAALGTDKELSDLLDFSAVRKSIFFLLLMWLETPVS